MYYTQYFVECQYYFGLFINNLLTHNQYCVLIVTRGEKMGKKEIASKLKQARINANMTQREVADILGMTYQAISNYERGKTKVESDILVKLCETYKISISDILLDIPINKEPSSSDAFPDKECIQNTDFRLQEIIHCYNNMTDEGKNLLLGQAQFYCQQFSNPVSNARAM